MNQSPTPKQVSFNSEPDAKKNEFDAKYVKELREYFDSIENMQKEKELSNQSNVIKRLKNLKTNSEVQSRNEVVKSFTELFDSLETSNSHEAFLENLKKYLEKKKDITNTNSDMTDIYQDLLQVIQNRKLGLEKGQMNSVEESKDFVQRNYERKTSQNAFGLTRNEPIEPLNELSNKKQDLEGSFLQNYKKTLDGKMDEKQIEEEVSKVKAFFEWVSNKHGVQLFKPKENNVVVNVFYDNSSEDLFVKTPRIVHYKPVENDSGLQNLELRLYFHPEKCKNILEINQLDLFLAESKPTQVTNPNTTTSSDVTDEDSRVNRFQLFKKFRSPFNRSKFFSKDK
ncbi:unnamed protein product [Brachionus calyciflorus]|uniref:Uncharacterized protein n=1 Tax=Brachionus calyciflorus TaxID=104777 RepID=A0A813UFC9_9BILA|nr:unnamed protein product [Brachionus calyciflorus]